MLADEILRQGQPQTMQANPHYDDVLAEVDALDWSLPGKTIIIPPKDPLEEMSHFREEG